MTGRKRRDELQYLQRSDELCASLRNARVRVAKYSRKELAARSGVSESTIQKIEEGKSANPGVFTIAALAVALDLDITDLLRRRTGPLRSRRLSAGADADSAADLLPEPGE